MSLSKELLHLLDDKDEPLPKRLKIADNALKSIDLPLHRKEAYLLRWLSKITKANDDSSWELLLDWLRRPQIQGLSHNDITYDDLQILLSAVTKGYKHGTHAAIITECVLEIIQNKTFQLFFKHNLLGYNKFVTGVLVKINCANQLNGFLSNSQLFHRHIISAKDFHLHFLQMTLPVLASISSKETFLKVSKLVDKCIFKRNFGVFSDYFKYVYGENGIEHSLPKCLIESLVGASKELYKLVFHSFCSFYDNFPMIYRFFGVLLQVLGFKTDSFFACGRLHELPQSDKCLSTLNDLCGVLCEVTCDLSLKLCEKSFGECLEYVLNDVLSSVEPCAESYEFLNRIVALHPLVLKTHLDEVLMFVLNDRCNDQEREVFLLGLFEIFAKLHRIPNLIGAMVKIVKEEKFVNSVKISQSVLTYFTQCITTLASWQVLELQKLLLLQLDDAVASIGNGENCVYIEFVSVFLCQFLMSVRMAEHTVSSTVVESFVKSMMELRDILRKFGTTLVRLEHNPRLMQTYLSLCLKWGDLYITLVYYGINNEIALQKTIDNDYSATNITYLHSYLSREQWRIISQRIANFGEKPCKQIMQNLCVQKLKAMQLFEESLGAEVVIPVATNILTSLDDQNDELLFNPFVLQNLIIPSCDQNTVKLLVKNIVARKDVEKLQALCETSDVIDTVLYVFLHQINKAFGKRNRDQTLTSKVVQNVCEDMSEVRDSLDEVDFDFSVKESELQTFLDLLKSVPIPQLENRVLLDTLFLYLIALRLDLKRCTLKDPSLLEKCENLSVGIAQSLKLSHNAVAETTVRLIVENFQRYDEVFNFCLQCLLRDKENALLHSVLDLVLENLHRERYMHCATLFLQHLEKFKNSKIPEDLRCYREKICERIFSFVRVNDKAKMETYTDAFAFVLKFYLFKNSETHVNELLSYLDGFIDMIVSSDKYIKGAVFLLSIVIKNKSKCKITSSTVLKIWGCIQQLKIGKEQHYFTKLIALTLQHVSEEDFNATSLRLLSDKSDGCLCDQLKIWLSISSCHLNSTQTKTWQNTLEILLYQKVLPHFKQLRGSASDDLIQLQLSLLQNSKLPLSASLLESILVTVSLLATDRPEDFVKSFNSCWSLLDSLIKNRKTLVGDYLPTYLQRYRTLLSYLCTNSNSDLKLSLDRVQELADCAHKFERLTKSLVSYDRALARISPYLVADILKQFERITIYPNVKIHLNNCLYKLLSLCDEHAIAYLKRVLSTASTEMFKVVYENYNKYYKFTGKV